MIPLIPGSGNNLEDRRDAELDAEHDEDCLCEDCCEERQSRAEYEADMREDR